jgi:hypothetical protein
LFYLLDALRKPLLETANVISKENVETYLNEENLNGSQDKKDTLQLKNKQGKKSLFRITLMR